jgi:hypothetical protein
MCTIDYKMGVRGETAFLLLLWLLGQEWRSAVSNNSSSWEFYGLKEREMQQFSYSSNHLVVDRAFREL